MGVLRLLVVSVALLLLFGCSRQGSVQRGYHIPLPSEEGDLKDVYFAFDSSVLHDGAQEKLRQNAMWLRSHPQAMVEVEGHCDSRGTFEYNMVLGERRAAVVADYLRSLGVSEDRLREVSYGEELPRDPRQTEEAFAKNRRVHFDILE